MAVQGISGSDFDYVVIGAGPAGLAAAGHLAKVGARVAVFEGRPRPENVFGSYPVVLNPRGISALRRLDETLPQRAADVGLDVKQLHIVPDNRTVATVRTFGTGIMRDQAAQLLLEHAEKQPTIRFFWEHKLESVDIESCSCKFSVPSGANVNVSNIAKLVAADGNRSKVRRSCAEQVQGFRVEEDPWGFQLRFMTSRGQPGQTEVDPEVHYVLGDKGYVCQQPNKVWSISLRVLPGVDEDFLTANEATEDRINQLKAYTEKVAGFAAKNLLDDAAYKEFYECRAFDGLVIKCSCLNPAGWICLIGDAAHAVQPATGEGINSGLEDAAVLGAMVAEHPEDPFTFYDAQHRPNAHALNVLALQARDKVVASQKTKVTNVMVTIGLGIAKKLHIIEGTSQDFMLGELAQTVGVKSYAELVAMEERQTRGLNGSQGASRRSSVCPTRARWILHQKSRKAKMPMRDFSIKRWFVKR
eukprot:TRINITY_DN6594_c0_g1_i1.p1 TRINITY_DN6594_c0_g1~~TRINITY_DN6594_c0_g1_i1.p1  ORF type:complete len:487 (-),score=87.59 TRINITY_DN6594_c0_g1_i1:266-1681(-)